jgi:2-octaprenyl-6-methoxyphenol hydroxylase
MSGIKTIGWAYPQTAILTTIRHTKPHHGIATQHFLPGGPFAILPLVAGNRSSIVWSEAKDEARRILALKDADFLAELAQRCGGKLGELALDGERANFDLAMHLSRSLTAERLALIGDSARGVHPLAGQGVNLAFRDVAALVETVIDSARLGLDLGGAGGLARYERWRRFDGVTSALAYDGINRLFSNANPVLRVVRDLGLGLTDRLPAAKNFFVAEAAGLTGKVPRLLEGQLP